MAEKAPLFDRHTFGRLLRAARIIAGHDRVEDAARAVTERTGVAMSARTLYALERGEQEPSATQYAAVTLTFAPPGGDVFWASAFSDEVRTFLGGMYVAP